MPVSNDRDTGEAAGPPEAPVAASVAGRFAGHIIGHTSAHGQETLVVRREGILEVMGFLRDEDGLEFRYLADITCVDRPGEEFRFTVVYHLFSFRTASIVRLKVPLAEDDPVVESATGLFRAADWHERECFDMFGVRFRGHPDLRRILMPDEWEGHPLRKDYPAEGR